jgi:hypothetical protein
VGVGAVGVTVLAVPPEPLQSAMPTNEIESAMSAAPSRTVTAAKRG